MGLKESRDAVEDALHSLYERVPEEDLPTYFATEALAQAIVYVGDVIAVVGGIAPLRDRQPAQEVTEETLTERIEEEGA